MFKNPFSFEGRIRRTEYGISLLIAALPMAFINVLSKDTPLVALLIIPLYWFLWAQGAKRCHDTNRSGWFQLIPFFVFWLIFEEGNTHTNEYGPNPKDSNSLPVNNNQPNSSNIQFNSTTNNSVYQGGYSGGHNSQNDPNPTNNNQNYSSRDSNNQSYQSGDLYK
jgi:hypothetical protein